MAPKTGSSTVSSKSAADESDKALEILPSIVGKWQEEVVKRSMSLDNTIHTHWKLKSGSKIPADQFLLLRVLWPDPFKPYSLNKNYCRIGLSDELLDSENAEDPIAPLDEDSTRGDDDEASEHDAVSGGDDSDESDDDANSTLDNLEWSPDMEPFEENQAWLKYLGIQRPRRKWRTSRPRNLRQFTLVEWAQLGMRKPMEEAASHDPTSNKPILRDIVRPKYVGQDGPDDNTSKTTEDDPDYEEEQGKAAGEAMVNHALLNYVDAILMCTPSVRHRMDASMQQRQFRLEPGGPKAAAKKADGKKKQNAKASGAANSKTTQVSSRADHSVADRGESTKKSNDKALNAHVDGYIKALKDWDGLCAIFEVKPYTRKLGKFSLPMQESAEMASWIAQTHDQDQYKFSTQHLEKHARRLLTNNFAPNHYEYDFTHLPFWRLMISQDFDQLYLTFAQYSPKYVDYVINKNQPAGIQTLDHTDFLHMRQIGPFDIGKSLDMSIFGRFVSRFARAALFREGPVDANPRSNASIAPGGSRGNNASRDASSVANPNPTPILTTSVDDAAVRVERLNLEGTRPSRRGRRP